jgi:hypothetical protein
MYTDEDCFEEARDAMQRVIATGKGRVIARSRDRARASDLLPHVV